MLALVFLWHLFQRSDSHALWMSPIPRFGEPTRLKQWPCGSGQRDDWNATYTSIPPGPVDITFRETINHKGAPYRIALTIQNDSHYDEFVLYDHIPHNEQGSTGEHDDPEGKWHRVTVRLPDIDCSMTRCGLQLIQIMSDKFSTPCPNPQGLPNSCGSPANCYFSCANVRISGSRSPSSLLPFYNSVIGGDAANRKPYVKNETSILWKKAADGYWTIDLPKLPEWAFLDDNNTIIDNEGPNFAGMLYIGSVFAFILVVVIGAAIYYGIKPNEIKDSIFAFAQGENNQVELESDSGSEKRELSSSD